MSVSVGVGLSVTWLEFQCRGIDTIPQASWLWSVRKDVTKVCVTLATEYLCPPRKKAVVIGCSNIFVPARLPITGPAGSRIELRVRMEQFSAAANAVVHAVRLAVPVLTGKGSLGTFFSGDTELLRSEFLFPLVVFFSQRGIRIDRIGHNSSRD